MSTARSRTQGTCATRGVAGLDPNLVKLDELQPALADLLRRDYPDLAPDAPISRREVDRCRLAHVEELLREERGELTALDQEVARSLAEGELTTQDVENEFEETRTLADRLSDALAAFGGSWTFLIVFGLILAVWIEVNMAQGDKAFDPYPFILLNLVLSCIAAIQAPIIMMSQNRQDAKDRVRSLNDYRVNLKAELEIRHLQEKIDHLISKQWQRLAEIQKLQIELMQERR